MTVPHLRPTDAKLHVERADVDGACPACGAERLKAYPVLSEGGWYDVVKCQDCLHSVERTPGPMLGPIVLLSDML